MHNEIIKIVIGRVITVGLVLFIVPGIYLFENEIQLYFPEYESKMFFAAVICFAGTAYAVISRNLIVLVITIVSTIAVPFISDWFFYYL